MVFFLVCVCYNASSSQIHQAICAATAQDLAAKGANLILIHLADTSGERAAALADEIF